MTQPHSRTSPPPLPRWLMAAGSLLIAYHVLCVVLNVLAAPSGPWPSMDGADMSPPPQGFAVAHESISMGYLKGIKQTHNYHFRTNRVGFPGAYLQIDLEDSNGVVVKTLRFPDPKAPRSLQRKQEALVRWVIDDQPMQRDMTERIPAPNQKIKEATIWEPVEGEPRKLNLTRIPENEVPNDRQVFRPSRWSLIVLGALARHLCRANDVATVSIARHSREPIPPRVLSERETPPEMEDLVSTYGRLPK